MLEWHNRRMSSFLAPSMIGARLRAGEEVEQWLGPAKVGSGIVLRFVTLSPRGDGHVVTLREHHDIGDDEWLDVYAFTSYRDDGEEPTAELGSAEEAIAYAIAQHGASADRFVAAGGMKSEYAAYLASIGGRPGPGG